MLSFNRLHLDAGDGSPVTDYRIENGRVEFRVLENSRPADLAFEKWDQLTPQQLTSLVTANPVLARWLSRRMGVFHLIEACNPESYPQRTGCAQGSAA